MKFPRVFIPFFAVLAGFATSILHAAAEATPAPQTPAQIYRDKVVEIVTTRWMQLAQPRVKTLPKGDTAVHIHVTADGKIKDVEIVSSDSKILSALARLAITECTLPPVPQNARYAMKNGVFEVVGFFSIYPPAANESSDD